MTSTFPQQQPGLKYLAEAGQETEILYKYGFDLPHFAMFPLLDDSRAMAELRGMYERYLDTAAAHGFGALMAGMDYRASPDWAELLGYSPIALEEMQLRRHRVPARRRQAVPGSASRSDGRRHRRPTR